MRHSPRATLATILILGLLPLYLSVQGLGLIYRISYAPSR